ncbi:MAG: hypothetical protein U9N76_06630 [Candidatus Marinimicrobia bacterium]|nr:hypothetical protein [Candidatus Neomarinimicrobiota bacterium]
MHNPNFNITEFGNIKNQSGSNSFVLTVKQWVERTNATGIISKMIEDWFDKLDNNLEKNDGFAIFGKNSRFVVIKNDYYFINSFRTLCTTY